MANLVLTDPSDVAITSASFNVQRGVPSAHLAVKIKNVGVGPVAGGLLGMAVKNPITGQFVWSGMALADERCGRLQITGQNTVATPGQVVDIGQTVPMGANAYAALPTILAGDWILADFWLDQGSQSVADGNYDIEIRIGEDLLALALPIGVSDVASGLISGKGKARSFPISGGLLHASGTPDALIHRDAFDWLLAGTEYSDASSRSYTFDQNDGAAAALASGESYIAVIMQDPTLTGFVVTRGLKGTTPTPPAATTGMLVLGYVTVNYSATTTVIHSADISQSLTYGRAAYTYSGTGLSVTIGSWEGITDDLYQRNGINSTLTLPDASTCRVWLLAFGTLQVVTTDDNPPEAGAIWLWTFTTSGGAVTGHTDHRFFIGTIGAGLTLPIAESDVTNLTTDLGVIADKLSKVADDSTTHNIEVPTQTALDNSLRIANTAYVDTAIPAGRPIPRRDTFTGDNSTNPWTLNHTPRVPECLKITRQQLEIYDGATADVQHYQLGVGGAGHEKEVLFGTILGSGEIAYCHYESFD